MTRSMRRSTRNRLPAVTPSDAVPPVPATLNDVLDSV